jgi:ubiquinone/menaquinone biosynthesis C-methylase UbiE
MLPRHLALAAFLLAFGWLVPIPSVQSQELPQADAPAKPAQPKRTTRRPDPHPHRHDGTYQGRPIADVMSYLGADWLMRPERIEEEQPDAMLNALEIQPGWTVADVGAGVGYHALRIARIVGPSGRVLATDVQPQMLQMLRHNLRSQNIKNVQPILCSQTDPKLPEEQVDLALMVDVYHEMSNPDASIRAIRKALKPAGKLVLVEFRAEDPDVPIKPEHKMSVAQVRKEIEPLGFTLKKLHDFLPWQHILIFEKTADPDLNSPQTPANPPSGSRNSQPSPSQASQPDHEL